MKTLSLLTALLIASFPVQALAVTCDLQFTVEVTQGVGPFAPGTQLVGQAEYATDGRSFRQEGGSTGYMASGRMALADGIEGPIWTLITTSNGPAADMVGVFARNVEGLSFAGVNFAGPMVLTLFGDRGTLSSEALPQTQAEWDSLTLRRSFSLHAEGADMLAGDVTELSVDCQ